MRRFETNPPLRGAKCSPGSIGTLVVLAALTLAATPTAAGERDARPPSAPELTSVSWRNYGVADGLPAQKIQTVRVCGDEIWVGTEKGAAFLRAGQWKPLGTEGGLSHPAVFCIAPDSASGDVWLGTAGGLTRYSCGRIDVFNQLNSGLANDVVYAVAVEGSEVWAATAAGCSRLDTRTGSWSLYDETNTPMHEIWCYGLSGSGSTMYLAVWGGGILEYDRRYDLWKEYRDPDREMEIDLFRDDGLVHDVVSAVWYGGKRVWAATYFGVSSYDGRRWKSYMEDDSGLASNFVNHVRGYGETVWFCTDRGLSAFDGTLWTTWKRNDDGSGLVRLGWGDSRRETVTKSAIAGNYALAVDFRPGEVWVATASGLSRGNIRTKTPSEEGDAR